MQHCASNTLPRHDLKLIVVGTVGAHFAAFCLQRTFKEGGIGYPFGMQLHGKTLGIVGVGAIGEPTAYLLSMH